MKEAEKWLHKAEKDLKTAKVNLAAKEHEAAAFFAHQSAEKALKAVYILKFKRLWKTHDLVGLLAALDVKDDSLIDICDSLNIHYIETRYPTEVEYTVEIARDAVEKAGRVMLWAKERIK